MSLTDTAIRNAKPSTKTQRLYDGGGMYLELSPAGGKWWRWKYRFLGKEKRLSLGTYPDVTLAAARAQRDEARRLLASGIDPSLHRQARRAADADKYTNSFEVVGREWHAKFAKGWVQTHSERTLLRLERELFPWLGRRPVADVSARDVLVVLNRMVDRGAVETARRTLQNCNAIFRYAIVTARAERNPAADLADALPPSPKTKHFAAIMEPQAIWSLLRAIQAYKGDFPVRCALQVAPYVFVRPGELRYAEWSEIDLDEAVWSIPAERMKMKVAHLVPLSQQALAILRDLHALTGQGRYVFKTMRGPIYARPIGPNTLVVALRQMGYHKDAMTMHGFRAMARTVLDEVLGFRPDYIEHQLAHAVRDPNGRAYNRTAHLAERRKMMQAWADYLDDLRADTGQKVVPFRRIVSGRIG